MKFRTAEKTRQIALKKELFSASAQCDGYYNGRTYPFCIGGNVAAENLHYDIREQAVSYFNDRDICWHGGDQTNRPLNLPSRHLCCSQCMCVNVLFPFMNNPIALAHTLNDLGYQVNQMLRFAPQEKAFHEPGYVAFEWIGLRNYLSERIKGRVAKDDERKRGAGFTSADFAVRFKRDDGHIQIVLGEWKYTERYPHAKSIRLSQHGTDRLQIYGPLLGHSNCPIKHAQVGSDALFFNPFDQMMRLQLLAHEMERFGELDADYVSFLHVAPYSNHELMAEITSPALRPLGNDIHSAWQALVPSWSFQGIDSDQILEVIVKHLGRSSSAKYIQERYMGCRPRR